MLASPFAIFVLMRNQIKCKIFFENKGKKREMQHQMGLSCKNNVIITNEKIAVTLHKKLQGHFTQSNMRSQKTKHLAN